MEIYKQGDKVMVMVGKSKDIETQQLSEQFGDTCGGVVIFQTGKIVAIKTDNGQINAFTKDVESRS